MTLQEAARAAQRLIDEDAVVGIEERLAALRSILGAITDALVSEAA